MFASRRPKLHNTLHSVLYGGMSSVQEHTIAQIAQINIVLLYIIACCRPISEVFEDVSS